MSQFISTDTIFFDNVTGQPLSFGVVYFGNPNTDPTVPANQKVPYEDAAFTTPATAEQTLTAAGKLSDRLYLNGAYSITVEDADGVQMFADPSVSGLATGGGGGSGIVETIVAGPGIEVDNTDPANPVVSAPGGGGGGGYVTDLEVTDALTLTTGHQDVHLFVPEGAQGTNNDGRIFITVPPLAQGFNCYVYHNGDCVLELTGDGTTLLPALNSNTVLKLGGRGRITALGDDSTFYLSGDWGGELYYTDIQLLLHADGSNGSTSIPDSSLYNRTVTAVGTGALSTAQQKFGTASLECGAGKSYIATLPQFSDMTAQFWLRFSSTPSFAGILNLGGGYLEFLMRQTSSSSTAIFVNGVERTFSWTPSLDTWYMVEVSYQLSGGIIRFFVDGTLIGTDTVPNPAVIAAGQMRIGYSTHAPFEALVGFVDEVRISSKIQHTASFTPRTTPFPNP